MGGGATRIYGRSSTGSKTNTVVDDVRGTGNSKGEGRWIGYLRSAGTESGALLLHHLIFGDAIPVVGQRAHKAQPVGVKMIKLGQLRRGQSRPGATTHTHHLLQLR
jgi:hypothetical protein